MQSNEDKIQAVKDKLDGKRFYEEFTYSVDGSGDWNPLTIGKLKKILEKFPDDVEVAGGTPGHAFDSTYIELWEDHFIGHKQGRKLLVIVT